MKRLQTSTNKYHLSPIINVVGFLFLLSFTIFSLVKGIEKDGRKVNSQYQSRVEYIVVKSKYGELDVTKDIVFGTGNWYDMNYYIVDYNNKLWQNVSKETFIRCEVDDTLYVGAHGGLFLKGDLVR